MADRRRDVTVAEVARAAGVGKATASRALGGYGAVSEDARSRVLAAAEALGYRPNGVARAMNTGRSKTIGVVVGDIENGYFGRAVRGIADVAQRAGYDVVLLNTGERVEREADAVRVLLDKRVDGVIVSPASAYAHEHLESVLGSGRPLVLLDRRVPGLEAPAVHVDLVTAADAATSELLRHGHRRIAFLSALATDGGGLADAGGGARPADRDERGRLAGHGSSPGVRLGISSVADRVQGMLDALARAGVEADPALIRFGAIDAERTASVVDALLDAEEPPTAVLASDSRVTLDLLRALRRRGVAVPRDLSLVVLDALEWTEFADPPLSAVVQPTYEVGAKAAATLLRLLDGARPASPAPLAARFVPRASIAPPRLA